MLIEKKAQNEKYILLENEFESLKQGIDNTPIVLNHIPTEESSELQIEPKTDNAIHSSREDEESENELTSPYFNRAEKKEDMIEDDSSNKYTKTNSDRNVVLKNAPDIEVEPKVSIEKKLTKSTPHLKKITCTLNKDVLMEACTPINLSHAASFFSPPKDNSLGFRYLNEFLVFGLDDETKNKLSKLESQGNMECKTSHTFSYPESNSGEESGFFSDFLTPFNFQASFSQTPADQNSLFRLFEIDAKGSSKVFFICLNSRITLLDQNVAGVPKEEIRNQIINFNPNKFFYYYCIDIGEFLFRNGAESIEYVRLPKFLCIKSFFPAKSLYNSILDHFYGISILIEI